MEQRGIFYGREEYDAEKKNSGRNESLQDKKWDFQGNVPLLEYGSPSATLSKTFFYNFSFFLSPIKKNHPRTEYRVKRLLI